MKNLLLVVAFTLVFAIAVFAQQTQPTPIPNSYVHDFAGVLNQAEKDELNVKGKQLKVQYKTEVGLVIIETLNGEDIYDYSLRMARTWGIGSKDNEIRGLLIVVATKDRKVGIRTSRHIEGEITDGIAGSIRREISPYFGRGEWGKGLNLFMDRVLQREHEAFIEGPGKTAQSHAGISKLWLIPIALFPPGFVLLLIYFWRKNKRENYQEINRDTVYPTFRVSPSRNRYVPSRPSTSRQQESYSPPSYVPDPAPTHSSSYDDDSSSSSSSSDSSSYNGGSDFGGGGSDGSF